MLMGKRLVACTLSAVLAGMGVPAVAVAASEVHISSASDMIALADRVAGGDSMKGVIVVLDNDIDFSGVKYQPIGNKATPFMGVFDGNGHTLSNVSIYKVVTSVESTYLGLFGYAQDATFKNLTVRDMTVSVHTIATCSEALLCPVMTSCTVSGCDIQGQVGVESGSNVKMGGVCLTSSGCTFENSTFAYAPGRLAYDQFKPAYPTAVIAKEATSGTVIRNCTVSGDISSGSNVGAFVSTLENSTIESCVSTASVTASSNDYGGGLVGTATNSVVSSCVNIGTLNSKVSGTQGCVGGIVGLSDNSKILNCGNYADVDASVTVDTYNKALSSAGCAAGLVGTAKSNSVISGCVNAASVTCETVAVRHATAQVGGLVGKLTLSTVSDSYNVGALRTATTTTSEDFHNGKCFVGGIACEADGNSSIINCYNVGKITYEHYTDSAVAPQLDGVAPSSEAEVKACVVYRGSCGSRTAKGISAMAGQMTAQDTYAGWDFGSTWRMGTVEEGYALPMLAWENRAHSVTLPDESPLDGAVVAVAAEGLAYTGEALEPAVRVVLGGAELTAGTDYLVSYSSNIDAGTAAVSVEGWGAYTGTLSANFQIARAANGMTAKLAKSSVKRGGSTSVTVKGASGKVTYRSSSKLVKVSSKGKVTASKKLKGTVKVTVKAAGDANHLPATKTLTLKVK